MKLFWVKVTTDVLVGEADDHSLEKTAGVRLHNPMIMQYIAMPQETKIHNGRPPQMVTGFKFLPIPCSEILLDRVGYIGEVKKHDGVYVTYYKILEAQKKNEESPLMVTQ
jgi:hypothetical protein